MKSTINKQTAFIRFAPISVLCFLFFLTAFLLSLSEYRFTLIAAGLYPLGVLWTLLLFFVSKTPVGAVFCASSRKNKIGILCLVIVVGLIYLLYISQDNRIFTWESGDYWQRTVDMYGSLEVSVKRALHEVYLSINNSEYNYFVPFLLAFPLHLLGGSRVAFCALVYYLFACPALVITVGFVFSVLKKKVKVPMWICVFIALTIPVCTITIIIAMYDTFCFLLAILVLLLIYYWGSPFQSSSSFFIKDVLFPFLLSFFFLLMVVGRRTFAFCILGTCVTVFSVLIIQFFRIIKQHKMKKEYILQCMYKYLFAALLFLVMLFLLFPGLAKELFQNQYAWQYQSYNNEKSHLAAVVLAFGLPYTVTVLLGSYVAIRKNSKVRGLIGALFFYIVVVCLAFWRIQDMVQHHYLLIAPALLVLLLISINTILIYARKQYLYYGVYAALILYSAFSLFFLTFGHPGPSIFFSNLFNTVEKRNDIDVVNEIADDLPSDSLVYVIGITERMSNSTLNRDYWQRGITEKPEVVSSLVDLRDGLFTYFFDADYVITTLPVQTKNTTGQHVLTDLTDMVMDAENPCGKHYTLIKTYQLDDNTTAYLYKRQQEWLLQDKYWVMNHFDELYPDHVDLFSGRLKEQS